MIVIADDITGAAEVAGVTFAKGLPVRLVIGNDCFSGNVDAESTMTVIATDTRSMSEADAVKEAQRICTILPPAEKLKGSNFLFKKTDSALRGHVMAELVALMQSTGYQRAVYLPANPSKGRIIRNGIYYIIENGTEKPLSETAFSYDPEFPAHTSSLRERFPDAAANGIIMPDAVTTDNIERIVATYNDGQTLFAGAADLFSKLLRSSPSPKGLSPNSALVGRGEITPTSGKASSIENTGVQSNCSPPYKGGVGGESGSLIVCGSTQSHPDAFGLPVSAMPLAIYEGSDDLTPWLDDALPLYAAGPLVLSIPHRHLTGKAVAVRLRRLMASLVALLFHHHTPTHLYIEGGATAFAVLRAIHISSLEVVAQPAPGVVSMRADDKFIVTLKPGSYAFRPLHRLAPSP